ncbi:MAG: hypothetical protein HC884_11395 [Chloroflexaceae bacterium]|nr:hypothetical protein [Chloroflexaceae bacterium]
MKPKHGPEDPELAEMLQEAWQLVSIADLLHIADELIARHQWFAARFAPLPGAGSFAHSLPLNDDHGDDLAWLARSVTTSKRDAVSLKDCLLELRAQHGQHPHDRVSSLVAALLNDENGCPVGKRIEAFVVALSKNGSENGSKNRLDERVALEAATGLLHFTLPATCWWWSRWMWDATTRTGILPLLAGSVHNLRACRIGEGYEKVGSVTAMSMRFAEGTGLLVSELVNHPQRVLFAADVFLACAYVVYLYGISSWRLSREFNRLLPVPPVLMRRLLGLPRPRATEEKA